MSDMKYNFAGIEAQSAEMQAAVARIDALLDEGRQSLGKLAAAWGGAGADNFQAVMRRWDGDSSAVKQSLSALAGKVSEAGQSMAQTEGHVSGMFS
jgi:early secretory antigenic target protein ESAT-6